MSEHIFFYGTLRATGKAEQRLLVRRFCEFVSNGTIQGRLYEIDGYPGAVESENPEDRVFGELYRILDPQALLPQLDDYEECAEHFPQPHEYVRKQVGVWSADGKSIMAWVYLYNHDASNLSHIKSGDYLKYQK